LRNWASALNAENLANKDCEAASNQSRRDTEARNAAPVTRTIIEIPDSVLQEYRRVQEAQDTDNRITRYISLTAVIIAGGVAGIGIWQGCLTRQANNFAIEALGLSQGADLLLAGIGFDDTYGEITYPFNNTGQRTAEIVKEHFEEAIIIRLTNIPIQHAQVDIDETLEVAPGKQTVGAGEFTVPDWQPHEMKAIRDTTHTIIFGGTITYSNGLGKFGETKEYTFCLASFVFSTTHELQWTPCNRETLIQVMKSPVTFRKTINKYGQ
jgi:hypothetical protein